MQGVEVGLKCGAGLLVEREVVGIAVPLVRDALGVQRGKQGRDGLDALELHFIRAGLRRVKPDLVERGNEVKREEEEQRQVAEKTQHEPPGHADLDAAALIWIFRSRQYYQCTKVVGVRPPAAGYFDDLIWSVFPSGTMF